MMTPCSLRPSTVDGRYQLGRAHGQVEIHLQPLSHTISLLPLVFACLQTVFTHVVLFGHPASQGRGAPSLHVRTLKLREVTKLDVGHLSADCLVTYSV